MRTAERIVLTCLFAACGRFNFDPQVDAEIPITFVQEASKSAAAATSAQLAFQDPIGAHHALVVCVDTNSTNTDLIGVTDSLGHTFATIVGPFDRPGYRHYILLAENTTAGADTLTVTISAPAIFQLYAHEYAGLATSGAFDASASAIGTSLEVDGVQSGFATTSASRELIFGYAELANTGFPGTGFTQRSRLNNNVTEDLAVDVAGDYQTTATMRLAGTWSMMMVTLRGQ